jgi:hypothetical protein
VHPKIRTISADPAESLIGSANIKSLAEDITRLLIDASATEDPEGEDLIVVLPEGVP